MRVNWPEPDSQNEGLQERHKPVPRRAEAAPQPSRRERCLSMLAKLQYIEEDDVKDRDADARIAGRIEEAAYIWGRFNMDSDRDEFKEHMAELQAESEK